MIKRLLVLVILLAATASAYAQADSLGIERRGEQVLVIHKVKSGQTLYALARRYGTSVKQINEANPILQQGLKVGQTLKVPFGKPVVVANTSKAAKTHMVNAGETLYAISRKYGVSVDELKKLNKLTSNSLALGQKLIIEEAQEAEEPLVIPQPDPEPVVSNDPVVVDTAKVENANPTEVVSPEEVVVGDTATQTTTPEVEAPAVETVPETVKYNGTPFTEVREDGVAELIVEDEPAKKFLALHKTAKVGTVIKIRNLKNDLSVYVRVVGNIPDTADNDNILIKINKRAHDQLKAFDPRLRVELTYFQ